jgi:hypothetical protein
MLGECVFFRAAESGSAQTRRLRSQNGTSIMHSAMTQARLTGAALDIAAAAAARRNGCTSGRSRARRASSNFGSARAPRSGHRPISFRDTIRGRRGRPLWLPR